MSTQSSELKPVLVDKHGPAYSERQVNDLAANAINTTNYFQKKVNMTIKPDYEQASEALVKMRDKFDKNISKLMSAMVTLQDKTKFVSGQVKLDKNGRGGGVRVFTADELEAVAV